MANERIKKLELTWTGKDAQISPEPRILLEQKDKAYGDPDAQNMLIHGDNLLALKSLEDEFAGQVKCIYIDPPYNTGNAFEHYEDGYEHSIWLSLMRDRLEILHTLLADDGVIFVQIDDNELPYLMLLMDEIFNRSNRVNVIAVKMSEATGVKMTHAQKRFPKLKEFILFYKKNSMPNIKPIKIPLEQWNNEYKEILTNIDEQTLETIKTLMDKEEAATEDEVNQVNNLLKNTKIQSLNSYFKENAIITTEQDDFKWKNAWRIVQAVGAGSIKEKAKERRLENQDISTLLSAQKKLYLFKSSFDDSSKDPRIRIIFADKYLQYNPGDFWTDIKTSGGVGQEGGVLFPKGKKPEALIQRVLDTCTSKGDLVLDSFLGSGTTAAVAHKMGRRWIGIELGDHAYTHCIPRLQKVIDGTDQGGISKSVGWTGGGGFKFYELASSLIVKDMRGFDIISKEYNGDMLAEAMCKIMGYKYRPDKAVFWKQGKGTENNWLFTTTMTLTEEYLEEIHEELGGESLLICCAGFTGDPKAFKNIAIKRIPKAILEKCEWNKPGYPLPVKEDFTEKDFEIEEAE